jgi:putative lipoic acid-binding regulatory protein
MSAFCNIDIDYPAEWHGRVIAHAHLADQVEERLRLTLLAFGAEDAPVRGGLSKNGSYITFAVKATIRDAAMMAGLPDALAKVEGVRMLL